MPFGKNALLNLAFLAVFQMFVWQQTELRFSCVVPFGPRTFLFSQKRRGEYKEKERYRKVEKRPKVVRKLKSILLSILGVILIVSGIVFCFLSDEFFFQFTSVFVAFCGIGIFVQKKQEKNEAEKKMANEFFTYDSTRRCITLKKRDPCIARVIDIEESRDVMIGYTPDKTIYTGVTVGGITTGGFDTIKGGYSMSLGKKTGEYYLTYKYARESQGSPVSERINYIILSDADFKNAMNNRFLVTRVASEDKKRMSYIKEKNVIDLNSLAEIQAISILNWLAGQD